jgi:hypothetical protein
MTSTAYLVITDGAGEYKTDYSIVVVAAESPADAVRRVTAPTMGYGEEVAYVAKLEDVSIFNLVERKVAEPVRWSDLVAEYTRGSGSHADFIDPDGLAHTLKTPAIGRSVPPRDTRIPPG